MDDSKDDLTDVLVSINQDYTAAQGYEGQLLKLAKGGCCFNRRYMIIRDGTISYYRDQPHTLNFIRALEKSFGRPKGQVQISICSFKLVDPNFLIKKKHAFLFEVSFFPHTTKNKKITWVFSVHTQEQLQKWINALEEAKNFAIFKIQQESAAQKRLEDDIAKEILKRTKREENFKKANELEKRRNKQREKQIEEARRKDEIESELKRLQLEAEEKRKKEEANRRREKYQQLLENSWDYSFQKIWSQLLKDKLEFDESLIIGIRLTKHVGLFLSTASKIVKVIINELHLPLHKRQIKPEIEGEILMFIHENMLIRLACKSSNNCHWKILGHEFRSNNMLFDALYSISHLRTNKFCYRIPLICTIDYKGFRGLVTALAPLEGERTLIHGSKSDGIYIVNHNTYNSLSLISSEINLKEHIFEWNEKIGPVFVHLSVFTELHKSLGYDDLEEYVQESMGKDAPDQESLENHVYLLKTADLLPVDYSAEHEAPDYTKRLRPEFFLNYPIRLSADCFINIHSSARLHDLELIEATNYLKTTQIDLLVESLDTLSALPIDSKGLTELFHQYGVNIRYLAKVAERAKLPHIKSMIYIEIIARTCKNLMCEHTAEYIKEIPIDNDKENEAENRNYNRTLSIFESPVAIERKNTSRFRSVTRFSGILKAPVLTNQSKSEDLGLFENNLLYVESQVSECIIDFFNLIFGIDDESLIFWDDILIPYAEKHFTASRENLGKFSINLNALLFSLCFHSRVYISFEADLMLGKTNNPFTKEQIQYSGVKIKCYEMKELECKILAEKIGYYRNIENFPMALQACEIKLRLSKAQGSEYMNDLGDPEILIEIGEILLETGDIENAMIKAKEALIQIHPLSASSVKAWCVLMRAFYMKELNEEALQAFENAITALNFHWGDSHPAHINLYLQLSKIHLDQGDLSEAFLLYKNSLLICLKRLGPNHLITAKVYLEMSQYYNAALLLDEALEVTEKAFFIYEASYGKESLITVTAGVRLAEIYVKFGRYSAAEKLIGSSCRVYEKILQNDKEIKENEYELKTVLEKYYNAAMLGLTLALKTSNNELMHCFVDKISIAINELKAMEIFHSLVE